MFASITDFYSCFGYKTLTPHHLEERFIEPESRSAYKVFPSSKIIKLLPDRQADRHPAHSDRPRPQREAEALTAILQKAKPFVPLLDDSEPNFRKSITIFSKSESVPLDIDRSFSSDVRLVLYEDGHLTRALRFRETCTRGFGWEQEEEEELDYAAAISLYGLDAIASGLAGALKELPAVSTMHQDLKERLRMMRKILEALQRTP